MDQSDCGKVRGSVQKSAQPSATHPPKSRAIQSDSGMKSFQNSRKGPSDTQKVLNEVCLCVLYTVLLKLTLLSQYWLYLGKYLETAEDPEEILRTDKETQAASQSVLASDDNRQRIRSSSCPEDRTAAR